MTSSATIEFEKKYNRKITDDDFIHEHLLSREGILEILNRINDFYYRPDDYFARACLASVIMDSSSTARTIFAEVWSRHNKI